MELVTVVVARWIDQTGFFYPVFCWSIQLASFLESSHEWLGRGHGSIDIWSIPVFVPRWCFSSTIILRWFVQLVLIGLLKIDRPSWSKLKSERKINKVRLILVLRPFECCVLTCRCCTYFCVAVCDHVSGVLGEDDWIADRGVPGELNDLYDWPGSIIESCVLSNEFHIMDYFQVMSWVLFVTNLYWISCFHVTNNVTNNTRYHLNSVIENTGLLAC